MKPAKNSTLNIVIVCKVIDNYGDAGFGLRLGRALASRGHQVHLFYDDPTPFNWLSSGREPHSLKLKKFSELTSATSLGIPDLCIEPFGTSSEQTLNRFELKLKTTFPSTPWLVVDYLSAEAWVKSVHRMQSTHPHTGHKSTFFYPGFFEQTGGIIHSDLDARFVADEHRALDANPRPLKAFVFCYKNAPLQELVEWCDSNYQLELTVAQGSEIGIVNANRKSSREPFSIKIAPRCPQDEFDSMMFEFDWLFVRGEDSFLRAQLLAKPFVWQAYPTEDGAHRTKLEAFFELYSKGLRESTRSQLWSLWCNWNGLDQSESLNAILNRVLLLYPEIHRHARNWQRELLAGPDLVSEILTWLSEQ